jgi:type IV pilus assembly protein PilY1
VSASTLEDVTDIRVWTTGAVDNDGNPFEIPSGTGIESFNQLEHAISTHRSGWYRDLDDSADSTGRNVNGSAYFRKLLFFTEYTPNDDQCAPEGTSKAYALYYKTGTAANFDVIGTEVDSDDSAELFVDEVDLGQGMASTPTIVNNSSGLLSDSNGSGTLAIQLGTGELETINFKVGGAVNGRESWREISLDGIDL